MAPPVPKPVKVNHTVITTDELQQSAKLLHESVFRNSREQYASNYGLSGIA